MKVCPRCTETKPAADFRPDLRMRDGLASWCKKCHRQYAKEWAGENPARVRRSEALYRASKPKRKQLKDRRHTLRKRGVDEEWYRDQMQAQRGLCGICHGPPTRTDKFHIDHCHLTERARGLLCSACNTGLGLLQDDPALLRAAADYVETR